MCVREGDRDVSNTIDINFGVSATRWPDTVNGTALI